MIVKDREYEATVAAKVTTFKIGVLETGRNVKGPRKTERGLEVHKV